MSRQQGSLFKTVTALGAHERPFSCVNSVMSLQKIAALKTLAALRACIRPLASVDSQMLDKVSFVSARFPALRTVEGIQFGVSSFMSSKI